LWQFSSPKTWTAVWSCSTARNDAAQILNWEYIDAEIIDAEEVDRRIVELAANLHRLELTALQRAEYEAKWLQFFRARDGQVARPIGGRQPRDRGIGKTANQLRTTRRGIARSEKIANISAEAKSEAIRAGLDNKQAALLAIATMPTVAAQLQKVTELASTKQCSVIQDGATEPSAAPQSKCREALAPEGASPPASAWTTASECSTAGEELDIPFEFLRDEGQIISRLTSIWESDDLRARLLEVPLQVRRRFIHEVVEHDLGILPGDN
jgi:hypothetical protein